MTRPTLSSCRAALLLATLLALPVHADEPVTPIDLSGAWHPLPHFWEQMFGSGRAVLALRDGYRRDLKAVHDITGVQYVRFHAIFHDEVGVYAEAADGSPRYNFSYVDQIYDGLRDSGVRPFVELSFMPNQLAARVMPHAFWYRPDVSPPKDYRRWDALITAFARHLIDRYGIDEVSQWYFEVWNEPNLDFWGGRPKQASYWTLYDHTARALKAVSPRLRVGGPATAQAAWVQAFIRHTHDAQVPVDFVSTHVYGNDSTRDVFGTAERIPRSEMVCRAVRKVHDEIGASPYPSLPLIWSEFNASYKNEPTVTDAAYMGPWLANTIRECDGLVDSMSYWTFSDVFEEQGVARTPFYGGFGLLAQDGIPKPAFNAFALLHRLGNERLVLPQDDLLVTRHPDGTLTIALWNYAAPDEPGAARTIQLALAQPVGATAQLWRVDGAHGDFHTRYIAMGQPAYPTAAQIAELQRAAALPPAETVAVSNGRLSITLPPHGLALLQLAPAAEGTR